MHNLILTGTKYKICYIQFPEILIRLLHKHFLLKPLNDDNLLIFALARWRWDLTAILCKQIFGVNSYFVTWNMTFQITEAPQDWAARGWGACTPRPSSGDWGWTGRTGRARRVRRWGRRLWSRCRRSRCECGRPWSQIKWTEKFNKKLLVWLIREPRHRVAIDVDLCWIFIGPF